MAIKLNFASETIWTGDNLPIMRGMNSDCVDLIYLDPPFNSNRLYEAPIGSKAAGTAFKDAWTLDDVDICEHGELAEYNPAAHTVIQAARDAHGKSMQAYLVFMAVRLLEAHRILKSTGSIYLHCDPTAGHFLKLLMDAIFGAGNFQSEIIWKRTSSHNSAKRWGPVHDTILFYSAGKKFTWNRVVQKFDPEYVNDSYKQEDEKGRFAVGDLTGSGPRTGKSGKPWRGIDPTDKGRHWAAPADRALPNWFNPPAGYSDMPIQKKLDALDDQGLIYWPKKSGGTPRFKRYFGEQSGMAIQDVIIDIQPIGAHANERTGYPTQKPLALLERIINASSNKGDIVFDPFCGCATTLVAADKLQRQWVGIDLSPAAVKLVDERIKDERGLWGGPTSLDVAPQRTDLGKLPHYRTRKQGLFGKQQGVCAGCNIEFRFKVMEVDHILPKSRGGTDHIENLQLLCSHCNRSKGNRTMAEWRAANLKS